MKVIKTIFLHLLTLKIADNVVFQESISGGFGKPDPESRLLNKIKQAKTKSVLIDD